MGDSHIASDGSDIHNNSAPLCGHVWDNKLRKPQWAEEIRLKRVSGSIQVHVQDWACHKSVCFPSRDRKQVYRGTSRQHY